MFIKIRLKNETYKNLEKFCRKNNLEINDFIEKTILGKIEMEMIKQKLKFKNIFEIADDDIIEDNIAIEDYLDNDDKIKH